MAKLKKTAGKTGSKKKAADKPHTRHAAKSITESAQQIWLAGLGAFNRAQAEGSKLFEALVRDGLSLEQTARKIAGRRASVVREAVEGHVDQARERAADTWDKLEKVFEQRVQRALVKLGVPSRDDLAALTERVERLTDAVRKAGGGAPARTASKPAAAATPAGKSAVTPRAAARTSRPAKPKRTAATKPATARSVTAKPATARSVTAPMATAPAAEPASTGNGDG